MRALSPMAEQLRFGRETARLTQVVAARRLGLSQPYLSQLESGRRRLTPLAAHWNVLTDFSVEQLPEG